MERHWLIPLAAAVLTPLYLFAVALGATLVCWLLDVLLPDE